MKNIGIIGSGAFGCALAHTFSKNNNIIMWSFTEEEYNSINKNHFCLSVPSIKLNNIKVSLNLEEVINSCDIIVLVTPSNTIRKMCQEIKKYYNNQDILLASKGMENDKLLSDVIKEEIGVNSSIIMGPSFAEEIGADLPTFV